MLPPHLPNTIAVMLLRFRPTDDIWPLHLLDLSDENHLSTTYKLLKFSPLALKFYLDTFVFPLVLGAFTITSNLHFSIFWMNSPNKHLSLVPFR
jgi:hypothetical protein